MARKFFHVCLGFLCLVVAIHLSARTATSVVIDELTTIGEAASSFGATSSGDVYYGLNADPAGNNATWSLVGHIPTSTPIISIRHIGSAGGGGAEYVWAHSSDGNFYVSEDNGHSWALKGNVFSGSTPAVIETWGKLKARYR